MVDQPIRSERAGMCAEPARAPRHVDSPATGAKGVVGESNLPLGVNLEPVLCEACGGRLSGVTWFRTTWQRGGALTGYANFSDDAGQPQPVVAKLPVPPRERTWLLRLQEQDGLAPRVLAHGDVLGGYDMAWVVMERLPYGPLGPKWSGAEFDLLIEAAGRFYAMASRSPATEIAEPRDWRRLFEMSRKNVHDHDLPQEQRWKNALKASHRKLAEWISLWEGRSADQWCHGDLHPANALSRRPAPHGPAVLIDFAEVHAGHWLEDAIYLEHLFWPRRQLLGGRKLCGQMAHELKKHGLKVDADWPRLASARRGLVAMSTPAMLRHDVDRHLVQAALEVLEAEAK